MRTLKWVLLMALMAVALLQLTNPARTNPAVAQDFLAAIAPPPEVATLFRATCYDCHSHETRWPWYSHVAPVSWGIVGDVNLARSHMDMSAWPANNPAIIIRKLEAMSDEIKSGRMPLPHYTLMHHDAQLTDNQRKEMVEWLDAKAVQIKLPKPDPATLPSAQIDSSVGRELFLKNCAHCHGADASGDEGPDLHKLDETDEWIANRIRNGKKGQMTAFANKLDSASIQALVAYLRTLK